MPMEVSGKRSRRRTIHNSSPAQVNIAASRARVRATLGCGAMKWKSCETATSENKETQRPSQVARLDAAASRDSARGAALVEAALGGDVLMGSEYEARGWWVP